ncbi:uncharacterized protein EURHEDRAFT_526108 [Aspergillus ruber CBS 135680]|uniref:Uncharacterized protein n=1 Tax=Aspergillus ruber (strain CBS 135680) TaxID=1388766 RepID=A0A017S6D5_ASPRC|nr:uncharacterized protein EURHEDRAFT_526108 [Aspergillus ruber CBS 135680]EYE91725.1 hypothetical protein EURHEDRAFT_526108 [Aspergillus ruber CBS 135680]
MCHYWTTKYTLCGCICDDIYQLCPYREYCSGAVLTQTEYEEDMCWQCRDDENERIRLVELVREMEDSAAEVLADTGLPVESDGEGEREKNAEKGAEGQNENSGGEGKGKRIRRPKLVTCDVSRACDPEVIKRGHERVRRACFDEMK